MSAESPRELGGVFGMDANRMVVAPILVAGEVEAQALGEESGLRSAGQVPRGILGLLVDPFLAQGLAQEDEVVSVLSAFRSLIHPCKVGCRAATMPTGPGLPCRCTADVSPLSSTHVLSVAAYLV